MNLGAMGGRRAQLVASVSILGLALAGIGGQAAAETTISTATTTPVVTSTANAGAPDNVTITSDGSVKPGSGTAVTIDSDNTVSNAGTISITDSDGAVGVSILGGHTGGFTNTGTILVDDSTTASDTDSDGDTDGAFAVGSGRYGIRLTGGSPFIGSIANSGSVTVEGIDSAAISLEAALSGNFASSGSVSATGTRAVGLNFAAPIVGDASITGAVSVIGEAAKAIDIGGDIAGRLTIQNSVIATGYRYTSAPTTAESLAALDADDLLQGGSALAIRANVAGGVLVDIAPTDSDSENDDEDGDGVSDAGEANGSITSYGAAPAIVVGAAGRDVAIGNVGDLGYGMVIKGYVLGSGVYDGIAATGLQLGTGGTVTTGGGVLVSGSVSAAAEEANATGLLVNAGASAPTIRIDGTLQATVTAESAVSARALVIAPGGATTSFLNAGSTLASLSGEAGDAIAILDQSGTLVDIQNTGTISATITPTDDANDKDDSDTTASNEKVTGRAVAIDLTANTSGASVVQAGSARDDDDDYLDTDEDGVADVYEPSITGSVLFGSGSDQFQILNGTVIGDLAFGAGANSLRIDGTASARGSITATGGTLDLSIGNGSLEVLNTGTLDLTRLDLASDSSLVLTADPATGATTLLDVAGQANIADGAKIGMRLTSLLQGTATYQIIQADSLTVAGLDSSLIGQLPYIYSASLGTNAAAGTVSISLSRKSAAELELPEEIAAAYEPFVKAIDKDTEVRDAVLAQTDREGLTSIYKQMLPERSNAAFEIAALASQNYARVLSQRSSSENGGAWIEEVTFGLRQKSTATLDDYKGWGIGFTGGLQTAETSIGRFGLLAGASSSEVDDRLVANQLEGGLFWRKDIGDLSLLARAGLGYVFLKNERDVSVWDDDGVRILHREAKSDWSGRIATAAASATYQIDLGQSAYLRPQALLEYVSLHESAYKESGGGDAIDIAVSARSTSRTSSLFGVTAGMNLGDASTPWGPEIQLGWRSVAAENVGATVGRFVSGGDTFELSPQALAGEGWLMRMGIKGGDSYGAYALEGGAEVRDGLTTMDLRLSARFNF